jgi:hypothetical protein
MKLKLNKHFKHSNKQAKMVKLFSNKHQKQNNKNDPKKNNILFRYFNFLIF